jgi:hypothetical protein
LFPFSKNLKKNHQNKFIYLYGIEVGVNTMEEGLARWS